MEIVSLVAGLLSLAEIMVKRGYTAVGRYRGAPQDYITINADLSHLVNDLRSLKGSIESYGSTISDEQSKLLMDSLRLCWGHVSELKKILALEEDPHFEFASFLVDIEAGGQPQEQQPQPIWTRATWIMRRDQAFEVLQQLKSQRENIQMFVQRGLV